MLALVDPQKCLLDPPRCAWLAIQPLLGMDFVHGPRHPSCSCLVSIFDIMQKIKSNIDIPNRVQWIQLSGEKRDVEASSRRDGPTSNVTSIAEADLNIYKEAFNIVIDETIVNKDRILAILYPAPVPNHTLKHKMSPQNVVLPSENAHGEKDGTATATCYCGAVQIEVPTEGEGLIDTFICHCTDCRKITARQASWNSCH